ncbi:hypothetical protein OHU11_29915 [Streptomyces sp. NBC_00257]|uniref:hypothetical protein n=1 Tax=unclassified Streptomyces TaxID=2593676 RepID=UPI00224E8FDB|nr:MULTISPECIES: hypothetical protein [unclassified Streptomyces]MCX5431868.1 hypothetical protein [Streptomyces sp. NBC_00062]
MLIPWTSSLIAAADPATVAVADDGTWTGTIALVNEWSADQRMLTLDEGAEIDVRPLPLPVTVQYITGPGHDGATVGLMTLDEVWQDGHRVMGRGRIDLDDPQGVALARKIERGFLRFVSADVDKVDGRVVCVGEDGQPVDGCDPADSDMNAGELYTRWRIMGASLLAHPAFPEAQIGLAASSPAVDEVPEAEVEDPDTEDVPWTCVRLDDETGEWVPADCDEDDAVPVNKTGDGPADSPEDAGVTAAAFRHDGWLPDTSWFRSPDLTDLQPVTVDEDGRVRGYLAAWGVSHRSYPGRSITPPRSRSKYALFNTRPVATSEGLVDVGLITMGTGHAALGLDRKAAASHYDDTGTMAAVVRAGEDSRGIWLAGAVLPDVTAEQRLRLSLSRFSGDWRQEGAGLELVAALAVNTEGFPVPERRRTEQGDYALVAAGIVLPVQVGTHGPEVIIPLKRPNDAAVLASQSGLLDLLTATDTAALADAVSAQQDRRTRVGAAAARVRSLRVQAASRRLQGPRARFAENWIEQTGTGHLPAYIREIADALIRDHGYAESRAIATAVNRAKQWCRGGGDVKADTQAKACAALGEWEAKRAESSAT